MAVCQWSTRQAGRQVVVGASGQPLLGGKIKSWRRSLGFLGWNGFLFIVCERDEQGIGKHKGQRQRSESSDTKFDVGCSRSNSYIKKLKHKKGEHSQIILLIHSSLTH